MDEILKNLLLDGKLDLRLFLNEEMEKQIYLSLNNHKIWQTKDGKFCTYVYDESGKRRLIRRKRRADIEDIVTGRVKKDFTPPTFEEVYYVWVARKIEYREIKEGTKDRYNNEYGKYLKKTIGNMRISDIDEDCLEDLCRDMIRDNNLSAKAYSNVRTIIIGTMKYARKCKYTDMDVHSFFGNLDISRKCFTKPKKKTQVFTDDEVRKITNFVMENKTVGRLGVLLCFQTGLREGELCAVKFEDIKDRYIHICRQEIKYKGKEKGLVIHEIVDYTKTDAGERDVILTPTALETIEEIRKLNQKGEYLMQNPDGSKIQTNSLNGFLYRMCDALNIERRSMHKIRKTYATALINAEVEDSITMQQLGHSDIATTRKYYYFANKGFDARYEKVAGAIRY